MSFRRLNCENPAKQFDPFLNANQPKATCCIIASNSIVMNT